jgi:c-di-GMP-binding flagellar brake protein YcgR
MLLISEPAGLGVDEEVEALGDGAERRRGLRIREQRPVKIFDSAAARYFGGQTEDISATGLRLELPGYAPVQPGDTLSIHVGLNRQGQSLANRRQMIPARVVWVNRRDQRISGKLEAGIEFLSSIAAHLDAA